MKSRLPFYIVLCGTLLLVAATSLVHADQKANQKIDQKSAHYLAQLRKASKTYDNNAIYQLSIRPEYSKILMQAARQNNKSLVQEMLAISYAGGDTASGTALSLAVHMNNAKLVQILLSHSPIIDASGSSKRTALHEAAGEYRSAIARILIDKGADIEARTARGETPLMLAASNKYVDTTQMLLEQGAKVNALDEEGRTALMNAAASGRLNEVKLLLAQGAEAGIKDKKGRTAFDLAALAPYSGFSDSPGLLTQEMSDELRLQSEADLEEVKRLLAEVTNAKK